MGEDGGGWRVGIGVVGGRDGGWRGGGVGDGDGNGDTGREVGEVEGGFFARGRRGICGDGRVPWGLVGLGKYMQLDFAFNAFGPLSKVEHFDQLQVLVSRYMCCRKISDIRLHGHR